MRRIPILIIVGLLSLPVLGYGQLKNQQTGKINFASLLRGGLRPQGLVGLIGLDASRFHISQSYTLAFMNFAGKSFSQGVYLNNMSYDFNIPLTLNMEWGMSLAPLASAGIMSPYKNGIFLSRASLEYKPSHNFQIGIQYSTYPAYQYNRSYLAQPWHARKNE